MCHCGYTITNEQQQQHETGKTRQSNLQKLLSLQELIF